MKRTAVVVAVVALVALAGCGGNGATTTDGGPDGAPTTGAAGDGGPTGADEQTDPQRTARTRTTTTERTTTTTERTTTTRTTTATTPAVELPPGTDESGITDRGALLEAFASVARETDYHLSGTWRDVLYPAEGPTENRTVERDYRASDADRRLFGYKRRQETLGNRSGNRTTTFYQTNSTLYSRVVELGNLSYGVQPESPFRQAQAGAAVSVIDSARVSPLRWNWTVAGTTTVHGREVVRYSLAGLAGQADGVQVRTAKGTALIDSRGAIHRLEVDVVFVDPGEGRREVSITHSFEPTASVDIEPPSWLDEARNATSGG